jgi:hypothetical protein
MITPERGFLRKLKSMDKRLDCVFRPEHGHMVIVYDRGWGEPVNLLLVKADDGSFRQPDNRELQLLSDGDMEKQRLSDKLAKTAQHMYEVRENDQRKAGQLIRDLTKDNKIQLRNVYDKAHGRGKNKAAFRPITYKPKGQVFA